MESVAVCRWLSVNGQRMDDRPIECLEGMVDHALALNARFAGELIRDDFDDEVTAPLLHGSGMSGVFPGFIDDV